ncbi:DHA2 family efflux MFS transporter permease subunit [Demequina oxidasica]|uniref:DHA2 family efflux MFS transporter permease subunit n=1 Tax=Demequina oxidasica TaxID=676199 RepID=UPI000B134FE5|nr:DHA2 family efflux MFS transporter permease subunit [Demequina oxidasica]
MTESRSPWPALWALVVGFFMILIDTTIVAVANPSIQQGLDTTTTGVIWVTSAYLLTYAVPLLVTGRLGDMFGPKRIYLIGLTIFTLASLWCGFADTLPGSGIGNLIAARAVQGLGAALMTPQTMAVITRTFAPNKRGTAMALWGATAGVATLIGPLLGGLLVDGPGWEWIFFVNVPIGVIAFVLAWRLVPNLETHVHKMDWLGIVLSSVGMFLLVFGLQEGTDNDWNGWVWASIIGGLVVIALFIWWQRINKNEPLLPLKLFKDRNFSLANATISTVGFAITSMFIPMVYFYQVVRGLSPTQTALMTVPTALMTLLLARLAGKLTDTVHPRYLVVPGMLVTAFSLWLTAVMFTPTMSIGLLLIPPTILGIGSAFMWGPISSTATRNLPMNAAGAGSGVYNTTRQVGAVLGSAAIATLLANRIAANLPAAAGSADGGEAGLGALPDALKDGFSTAMGQTLYLPAVVLVLGAVLAYFFVKPAHMREGGGVAPQIDSARTGEVAGASSPVKQGA